MLSEKESLAHLIKKYEITKEHAIKTRDKLRKNIENLADIIPIKEFGTNYAEFYRDGVNAVKKLLAEKQGQVAGAFHKDGLGDIDLVWGEVGSGKSDGWGLAKIAKYHPEVLENLDELVATLPIKKETQGRYQLENEQYKIGIRKEFDGKKTNWVLTAFEKDRAFVNRTDFDKSPIKDSSKTTELSIDNIIPKNSQNESKTIKAVRNLVNETKHNTDDLSQNYSLKDKAPVMLTKQQRKEINEQVKELIKKDVKDITADDREILRLYTGEGGLGNNSKGALTQHYTPYPVIDAMFNAITKAGIEPKTALEPAVGAGNFIGLKPELKWDGVDIDDVAVKVSQRLYPKGEFYNVGFEEFKKNGYDLVISNVPFLETRGAGALKDRSDIKALHDYYFIKGVDSVKDDGIVAFITSRGVADKADKKIRKELMDRANIVGMYRLSEGTFRANTHTDVGTDIIFLQKRKDGVSVDEAQLKDNEAFINSTKTDDDIYLNDYYKLYPQNILGDMQVGVNKAYGTKSYNVIGESDLSKIELKIGKNLVDNEPQTPKELPTIKKEFLKYADDNGLYFRTSENEKALKNIFIEDDAIMLREQITDFSDVAGVGAIYKDVSDTTLGKKINLLNKIKNLSENGGDDSDIDKLIQSYKKQFKKHPYSDKELSRAFNGQKDILADLGSFFDDKFSSSSIVKEQTRYENMGRIDVDRNSDIKLKLHVSMDNKGEIDFAKGSEILDKDDFLKAINNGYSITGINKAQNDVLYYAGNISKKLDELERLKTTYAMDKDIMAKLEAQEARLNEVMPPKKEIENINFNGSEAWLRDNGINLYELNKVQKTDKNGVVHTELVAVGYSEVFNNYLNSRALIKQGANESDTVFKARMKQAQEFLKNTLTRIKEKAIENLDIKSKIETIYNKIFNSYVTPDYKQAKFLVQDAINEASESFKFRDNQTSWAAKAMFEGKGINSHDVGGGKTASAILLARALKLKGAAKKPLFVVPSKVIKNWEAEIKKIYPKAKIFNLYNLPEDKRLKMLSQLGNEQADYVLISHEAFEKLSLPQNEASNRMQELLYERLLNKDNTGRQRELDKERIEQLSSIYMQNEADKKLTIDRLGIDAIFIDEARAFKNVGFNGRIARDGLGSAFNISKDKNGQIKNLNSARAYDALFKTQFIAERNNNSNIFLLDATLTPNKPMELYTAFTMLDKNILKEYGIDEPIDFKDRYLQTGTIFLNDGSRKNGLTGLQNVFELDGIMTRYIDHISMKEFAKRGIKIPKENVKFHYLDPSDETTIVFDDVSKKMQEALNDSDKRKDVMGIYAQAVNASADPRLYSSLQINDLVDVTASNNKIAAVVDMVSTKRSQKADAGQIIFLDNAGHGQVGKNLSQNLHQEIKQKLIKSGKFKENEIAIISGSEITNPKTGKEFSATGDKMMKTKQEIVDSYNAGKIKVVIGTTKSAGEGLNIQKFTTDIYHLNMPWTMAEVIQRNGRGIRSGNINKEVGIHYFFQHGTFDQKMYEVVNNKRGWNEALWSKDKQDFMEVQSDESAAMPSIEEIAIMTEKDPIKRQMLEKQLEYDKLNKKQTQILDDIRAVNLQEKAINAKISELSASLDSITYRLETNQPNTTLQSLAERIMKAKDKEVRANLQSQYDDGMQKLADNLAKMKIQKQKAIAMAKESLENVRKNKEILNKELSTQNDKVYNFERENFDEYGNIRSGLEVC
ncbi:helicase-related protein [Campylobacter sp. PS10]|uniref:Helicase-related protein n=2 Tax=Campylobacter gastrosuis TaxID=2974576 RepID=A0ABT7HSF3_9BACT|nr:helicase-related protein [Campylobacter gastrosuis]MDL0089856.1 helicase-related protein [Campylobacter gastrosuis]